MQILTYYTICKKYQDIPPTIEDIHAVSRLAILGDDRTLKVSQALGITFEDLESDSKDFGLVCSPAKTSSGVDFCSRAIEWDPVNNIAWPALKLSSVYSMIHWYADLTTPQILSNLDTALYEAALHSDPMIFRIVLDDAMTICDYYGIDNLLLSYHSRDIIRRRAVRAIRGEIGVKRNLPRVKLRADLQYDGEARAQHIEDIHDSFRVHDYPRTVLLLREFDFNPFFINLQTAPQMVFSQIMAKVGIPLEEKFIVHWLDNQWHGELSFLGVIGAASAPSKKATRIAAYRSWLQYVFCADVGQRPDITNE